MNIEKLRFKHVLIFMFSVFVLWRFTSTILEIKKLDDLAQKLGIDRNDYPDTSPFPINYFSQMLQPNITTIKDVHVFVKEYELVLHCRRDSEVYYYYSKYADEALRFAIVYDDNGKYVNMSVEDEDSGLLQTENCVPGLLSENIH